MKTYATKEIRNVAVLGHGSCGKTSLTNALVFAADSCKRLGSVDEGNSLTDYGQAEIERKISINVAMAYAEWKGCKVNLVDTPGYMDFVGDAYAAVRCADNALIVVNAVSGVEIGTELAWRLASEQNMPVGFYINMMDKENADFQRTLGQMKSTFEGHIVPMTIPIGAAERFTGTINLFTKQARIGKKGTTKGEYVAGDIPADLQGVVDNSYKEFLEAVVELDENLMEKYFADEAISEEELMVALRKGVVSRQFIPVWCGSATLTYGMRQLLDGLTGTMADPTELAPIQCRVAGSQDTKELSRTPDGPGVALVFKTITEPHVGELSYIRVFSGVMKSGGDSVNANDGQPERMGHISIMQGHDRVEVDELPAGDIGCVTKLKHTHTGNTLEEKGAGGLVLPEINYPKPVMNLAIVPKKRGDEDKIGQGLRKLQEEDRTFHSHFDPVLSQQIVSGMGELHLEVIRYKLAHKFNVEAEYIEPKIPYRETIRKQAEGQGKYKKQSGGRGQYGDCWVRMIPLPAGSGIEFEDKIVGGVIPGKFVPGVEKGVREAAERGVLAGFPLSDFRAECFDGSYHSVDSSDVAFQIAGSMAFQKVAALAGPVLLEPIQLVEVLVPEEHMGDVIGDLNSRRGKIMGMDSEGNFQKVTAKVPLSELYKYSTTLRSITQGRGAFTSEFAQYDEVPRDMMDKVIEKVKSDKEE